MTKNSCLEEMYLQNTYFVIMAVLKNLGINFPYFKIEAVWSPSDTAARPTRQRAVITCHLAGIAIGQAYVLQCADTVQSGELLQTSITPINYAM
jgi:hypothetical protein